MKACSLFKCWTFKFTLQLNTAVLMCTQKANTAASVFYDTNMSTTKIGMGFSEVHKVHAPDAMSSVTLVSTFSQVLSSLLHFQT